MRHMKCVVGLGVLLAGVAGAWVFSSETPHSVPVDRPEASEKGGSGILDGMTFTGQLGLVGKPADIMDTFVFANGLFTSTECDRQCGYPPAPYFIRRTKGAIEFVSASRCRNKDSTLEWRGIVEKGTVRGRLHWTANRWYWTIKKEFRFEGKLVKAAGPVAGNP